jgi:thiazole/oxazole-forming peptide maturase SagD family component
LAATTRRPTLPERAADSCWEALWLTSRLHCGSDRHLSRCGNCRQSDPLCFRLSEFLYLGHRLVQATSKVTVLDRRLVDPMLGIVHSVAAVSPSVPTPKRLQCFTARCSDLRLIDDHWRVDQVGSGCAWNELDARLRAVGEAIERYCGNVIPRSLPDWSSEQAKARGALLTLDELKFFSDAQRERLASLYDDPRTRSRFHWTDAEMHVEGRTVRGPVPVELTHLKYAPRRFGIDAARSIPMLYAGIAAHSTRERAIEGALREVVERHHTSLWWYGGVAASDANSVDFTHRDEIQRELDVHYNTRFAVLGTDVAGTTVACALERLSTGVFLVGFSCKPTSGEAAAKALCEALQLHEFYVRLGDAGSWLRRAEREGRIGPVVAARDGVDSINDSLTDNLLAYRRAGTFEAAKQRWEALVGAPMQPLTPAQPLDPREYSLGGRRVVVADLDTDDIRGLDFHVVRVFVPECVTNTAHHLLPDAHPAWDGRPLDELLATPHLPHA